MRAGPDLAGSLTIDGISKHYADAVAIDHVSLEVRSGEFLTLLGPSGSGKTTTLRIVAGFIRPDSGAVYLNGRDITGVRAHQRNIGNVFQNYALFPHMTAFDNIAFPLKVRHVPRPEIRRRVEEALELVQLSGLGGRYARQLSGGQQQRVALARAIVFRPPLLLMDEPLGALDKKLRDSMQTEISRISRELGVTVIYVTHDQEEALAMSDRIAICNHGHIEQLGSGEDLYERPASLFVAGFMGESTVFRGRLESNGGQILVVGPRWRVPVSPEACRRAGIHHGSHMAVVVRPERLRAVAGRNGQHSVSGKLVEQVYLGAVRRCVVDLGDGQRAVARVAVGEESAWPELGREVHIGWDLEHGVVVPDPDPGTPIGHALETSPDQIASVPEAEPEAAP